MAMNHHAAENADRTDDDIDREWSRCFLRHASDVWCDVCEQSLHDIRALRARGVACGCRDPDALWCELHGITLCNG